MKSVAQEVPGIFDWTVTFKTNIVNLRKMSQYLMPSQHNFNVILIQENIV